jgi:hypothetical protein
VLKKGTDGEVGETANLAQHNYAIAIMMLTIHPASTPELKGTSPKLNQKSPIWEIPRKARNQIPQNQQEKPCQ